MERLIKKLRDKINKISPKWDIFLELKFKNEILINDGKIEKLKNTEISGVAVRIFKNNKMAFVCSIIKDKILDSLLHKLKDSLFIEGYEKHKFFNNENTYIKGLKIYDENIKKESLKRKTKKIIDFEKFTKKLSKKIKFIRDTGYFEDVSKIFYLNSEGFKGEFEKSLIYTFLSVIANDKNDEVIVDGVKSGVRLKDINLENLGKVTAKRAVNLLNGKSISSGRYDLIFPSYVSSEFVSYITPLFYADNIRKKKSLFWQEKEGNKILSEKITIRDDALLNWYCGSFAFDGEGNSGENKNVVENGILKNFLFDNLNAVYFNKEKAGNSIRKDFQKLPECGVSNFYIEKGKTKLKEILKNFTGIFINSIMGGHTIDTVSGNFSLGVNGWFYNKGKIIHPIKEVLMTGNLKELFYNVEYVCDDIEFYFNYGSPSLLIKNILISGKE